MDRHVRDNGHFVLLVVGIVVLAAGVTFQPLALIPGVLLTIVGAVARPIEEIVLKEGRVKWQREVVEQVQRRLDVVVTPATARLRLRTFEPTVIVRPQSPDEFAETLVEQVIKPMAIGSQEQVNAPTVMQEQPPDDAKSGG